MLGSNAPIFSVPSHRQASVSSTLYIGVAELAKSSTGYTPKSLANFRWGSSVIGSRQRGLPTADVLRILYHHRTLGDGAEGIHIREMVSAFRELGHEVRIVSMLGDEKDANTPRGPSRLGWVKGLLPKAAYEAAELGYNFIGRRRIAKAIGEFQPDLIFDRYNTFCTAAVNAGRAANIPVFLEVNAPLAYERISHDRGLFFAGRAIRYERAVCELATKVFVVSTPLKDFLMDERGIAAEKIVVLPNGVNTSRFSADTSTMREAARKKLGIPDTSLVVGFTGILRPWHGVEMLCEAFRDLVAEHPNLHLLIVGDGPSEDVIRTKVGELGIGAQTSITGRVSHADIPKHLAAMNIAVSPRATFYASPMKIVEYLAMGIPVVAPDMPNIRDLVDGETEAILFECDNRASLKVAFDRLIADADLRERIGRAGLDKVRQKLNWKRNASEVVRLFESLLCDR